MTKIDYKQICEAVAARHSLCYRTAAFPQATPNYGNMPTYEYQCAKCKKSFEIFQSMKDEPLQTCPEEQCCMKKWGKGPVKRMLGTGAGLIFKGSGFYITDYRSEGYKASAKKDSGSGAGASDTKKSETKPAKEKKSSASKKD